MKRIIFTLLTVFAIFASNAQEESSKFSFSTDLVSRYVWRGTQFSDAPAIQPGLSFATGGLTVGAWGSYALNSNFGAELDLYAGYDFDFGLGVILTDYFFPSDPASEMYGGYFDKDLHTFELGLTYSVGNFSLGGYKYLNQLEDLYVEASYDIKNVSLFAGAGDQLYTNNGEFNLCNVGIKVSKEVKITDTFIVSPYASFSVNPNREQGFLVIGLTL